MSAVPTFHSCLVCDLVRPELAGKLSILGFFGVCPNVDIGVARIDQPTVLTFLITGDPGEGQFMATVSVVDDADERLVGTTGEMPIIATAAAATVLAPALMLVFGRAGPYSARLYIDGAEQYRGVFRISQGV